GSGSMTSEQNMPEVQSHQGSSAAPIQDGESQFSATGSVPHGMGQSKSSRRRRRKRKTKGPEGSVAPQSDQGGQVPSVQASSQPQQSFQQPDQQGQPFQGGGQQHQQGGGGAGKRWKKKFRDR